MEVGIAYQSKISNKFTWSLDYLIDFVGFPYDEFNDYTMHKVGTGLTHNITDMLYQKLNYEYLSKHYPKWMMRNSTGVVGSDEREDNGNAFKHELGILVGEKTLVKAKNRFYINDSDEDYLDFYDYKLFETAAEINHILTDRLSSCVSFGYQRRLYDQRDIIHGQEAQHDDRYMCCASLLYELTKNVSAGINFDYTYNNSNDFEEKYKDCIISTGIYSSF